MELLHHVAYGGGRSAFREGNGQRTAPRLSVVVTDRPTPCATDRVAGCDGDRRNVPDPHEVETLATDDERSSGTRAKKPTPEHESATLEDGPPVMRDEEDVVQLRANERTCNRGE